MLFYLNSSKNICLNAKFELVFICSIYLYVHSIKVFVLNVLSVFVFEKGDTVDTDDAVRCTQCGFLSGYRAAMNLTAFQPSNHCNCCKTLSRQS